jgi:hypothetical protein
MRACARVALVLMALSASFGLAGCAAIDDLKDAASRWFDIGKPPTGRGVFADDVSDATPVPSSEKPLNKEASKASKKKDKPASNAQRPQTVEKKVPTPAPETARPQSAEPQSVPPQPVPSQLRTLWPEAPAAGTFSR